MHLNLLRHSYSHSKEQRSKGKVPGPGWLSWLAASQGQGCRPGRHSAAQATTVPIRWHLLFLNVIYVLNAEKTGRQTSIHMVQHVVGGMDQDDARDQDSHLGLPRGWQGPNDTRCLPGPA